MNNIKVILSLLLISLTACTTTTDKTANFKHTTGDRPVHVYVNTSGKLVAYYWNKEAVILSH